MRNCTINRFRRLGESHRQYMIRDRKRRMKIKAKLKEK